MPPSAGASTIEQRSLLELATLAARLEDLLGVGRVSMRSQVVINGVGARIEALPRDVEQLAGVLSLANAEGVAVCVAGGGSKLAWGSPPARFDLLVSTRELPSFCEVDADDLTLTASAGMTLTEAGTHVRAQGRVLPLDGGDAARATLGGVVATADQGARGAGYGGVRDVVLGVKALLADGTPVRFGGRTMKNVAGYDMTKLFVGSFGVLGVITEVTLRLLPHPGRQAAMVLPLESLERGREIAAFILGSPLEPLVLEATKGEDGAKLVLGFAGHSAAVERSLREVQVRFAVQDPRIMEGAEAESAFDALAEPEPAEGPVLKARATVPVSTVWSLAEAAEAWAATEGLGLGYRIGAARGTLHLRVGAADPGILTAFLTAVRHEAVGRGGQLSVRDGVGLLTPGFDVWGEPVSSVRVMKRIKERLDPHGTLNPGRFVGGI